MKSIICSILFKKDKRIVFLIFLLFVHIGLFSQNVQRTINVPTPGSLEKLLGDNINRITDLKITGTITHIDFVTITKMRRLISLDISDVNLKGGIFYSITSNYSMGSVVRAEKLKQLILPKKIKKITAYAFKGATFISELKLSEGLEEIDDGAFEACPYLKKVILPSSLKKVGSSVFADCPLLESVTFPDNLNDIGSNAFRDCKSLTTIKLPQKLRYIANSLFLGCINLKQVNLPNELERIEYSAFESCAIETVEIPQWVSEIASEAFDRCNNLKTVIFKSSIPPTVEGRKEYLFNSNTVIYIQNKALGAYLQVRELSNCKLLDCNTHK